MNYEWRYTVDPTAEEPILLINDEIGFNPETGFGIDGALFQQELLCLDGMGKKRIQVWINSIGGSVLDGYSIYSAILKSKTKVDTYCVGMAASIAGVIFQAGRTRYMSDYSFLMYHNPSGTDDGKIINMMKDSIAKMTARSGKDEAEILKMMGRETYINAADALEYGLCDEIEDSTDQNKKRLSVSPVTALYKEAKLVLNSIFEKPNPKDTMSMLKVTNRLNLNAEASEDAILSEVNKILNRAEEAENRAKASEKSYEDKMKDLENKKAELEEEMDKLKKEKEASDKKASEAEDKAKKMEDEKKAAEDKAMEEECKNVLNKYTKLGKIKNDAETASFWTAILKADKELGIKQLEALPLNKQGAHIETASEGANDDLLTSVAARAMANVRNKLKMN